MAATFANRNKKLDFTRTEGAWCFFLFCIILFECSILAENYSTWFANDEEDS